MTNYCIYRTVTSAGYSLDVCGSMRDISQQPMDPRSGKVFATSRECGFDFHKLRHRIAKEITQHALTEPSYIHPETGDNILHALARLRLQESTDLISRIRQFASEDVDLNLRNCDEDGPLSAFTQELRNWDEDDPLSAFTQEPPDDLLTRDETGATISKYLDALLWKDPQKRIPNKINVNMRNREGATPLYYAAIRARPDSVRSLIEAGANVNARLGTLQPVHLSLWYQVLTCNRNRWTPNQHSPCQ
jgi:hypothetical protein